MQLRCRRKAGIDRSALPVRRIRLALSSPPQVAGCVPVVPNRGKSRARTRPEAEHVGMSDTPIDRSAAPSVRRTRELKAGGWSDRTIRAAVGAGRLIRLRDGVFCLPDTHVDCVEAGRMRGRLTCVSELRRRGVFVLDKSDLHVHIVSTASRLPVTRTPRHVHRRHLRRTPDPASLSVDVFDAIVCAVLCQDPRAAVATIDSALHHGLLRSDDLDELFAALPRRYRVLRRLVDSRAESGSETLMRLLLRSFGCTIVPQAHLPGVGRVDFLVDGWLIVECDSKAYHSTWEQQINDRRRDQQAAALGYVTYRAVAEDVMWHADTVRAAVAGLLGLRRR